MYIYHEYEYIYEHGSNAFELHIGNSRNISDMSLIFRVLKFLLNISYEILVTLTKYSPK